MQVASFMVEICSCVVYVFRRTYLLLYVTLPLNLHFINMSRVKHVLLIHDCK